MDSVFSIIPVWLFIVFAVVALLVGRGIRWWLDRRDLLAHEQEKERRKAAKKQRKHNEKVLRAERRRKG